MLRTLTPAGLGGLEGLEPLVALGEARAQFGQLALAFPRLGTGLLGAAFAVGQLRTRLVGFPPRRLRGRLEGVGAVGEFGPALLGLATCVLGGGDPALEFLDQPGAAGLGLPSLSGIGLLASIGAAATALGDEVRCMRVDRLLQYLLQAPPPAGGGAACAALLLDESVRAWYAAGATLGSG